jgi:arabinogalactan oligomer / maltooligosaccharide transport system permease protein
MSEERSRTTSSRGRAIGVAIGLLAGALLQALLLNRGDQAALRAGFAQASVISLEAAVELVAAAEEAGRPVQEVVQAFAAAHPDFVHLRVVDLGSRQLIATSEAAADAPGGLPARLDRQNPDHKDWYDRGQARRAARQANLEEGRKWKEEIEVQKPDENVLRLAAPLLRGQEAAGVVLLERRAGAAATAVRTSHGGKALLFAAAGTLAFVLLSRLLRGEKARLVLGLATLAVTLFLFREAALSELDRARRAAEVDVAAHLAAEAGRFQKASGLSPAGALAWDVDRYGDPRGVFAAGPEDAAGKVDDARIAAAFAEVRGRFGIGFGALALFGILLGYYVAEGWAAHTWYTLRRHREAYGYVAPALLAMLVLVFFPFIYGTLLSFTSQTLYNLNEPLYAVWAGFDNYLKILTDFDLTTTTAGNRSVNYANFYYTLGFTLVWTVSNVSIGVGVGLVLALILDTRGLALRPVYRVLLVLPWAVPNYITALIWKGMFHQQFGVVNQVAQLLGASPIAWFDSPGTSFLTVLATNGWLSFPFMMVVSLGALQSIPADLYEAAKVDGASRWQQFKSITLPSLKPALVPAVILSVVWTFNMFNIIYLVSQGQPGGATEILVTQSYKLAFEQYQYGYAAAYATVIFGILLVYGVWQNRVTRAYEGI